MEDFPSMNSLRKNVSSSSSYCYERTIVFNEDSHEESGWTTYLDDFFAKNNHSGNGDDENNTCFSFDDQTVASSSFLISDAASLTLKKSNNGNLGLPIDNKISRSRLSFKKRKTKVSAIDDSLEDTASSPVNSPKVYDIMNQRNKNSNQKQIDISQDKGNMGSNEVVDERSNLGFMRRESDNTELKKRGLCLVPLSMVVNYFG